jgi:spermidine synthase
MTRAWVTLDRVETPDGSLELRQRGDREFLISIAGRVLMNSAASLSEQALGQLAVQDLECRPAPRVLVGGLGMGCTLRASLDRLPADARVRVVELNPDVVRWCRGPLAALNRSALDDPRVAVEIADVAQAIGGSRNAYDAILLDLYEGPGPKTPDAGHPHYGAAAVARARVALRPGGALAVWCEDPAPGFEGVLSRAGFRVERRRAGRGGRRHVVTLARVPPA